MRKRTLQVLGAVAGFFVGAGMSYVAPFPVVLLIAIPTAVLLGVVLTLMFQTEE